MCDLHTRLEDLKKRHSVRSFLPDQLPHDILKQFSADITMFNTHEAGFHFVLVSDDQKPFEKYDKSYGVFRNVRNYLACIVDTSFPNVYERAGYCAEEFVIKCTRFGIGTCFVSGTYSSDKVSLQMRADWKLLFLVVLGLPQEGERWVSRILKAALHKKIKTPRDFFHGTDEEFSLACEKYPWLDRSLEALAVAPSSMNKRPVRISLDSDMNLRAQVQTKDVSGLIDLGIAKYNMDYVSPGVWETGNNTIFYED